MPSAIAGSNSPTWRAFAARYGTVVVLLVLCAAFSVATMGEQSPSGAVAADALAARIAAEVPAPAAIAVVARGGDADREFAARLAERLPELGYRVAGTATGGPPQARAMLAGLAAPPAAIAATPEAAAWPVLEGRALTPPSRRSSTFLKVENLRNVANQIVVIAIIAAGMTMVIVTGGIDLSVGSLIALSAVVCAGAIRGLGGGGAGAAAMLCAAAAAVLLCGLAGLLSGLLITSFGLPPFIATLGMMQVASGIAYIIAHGQSIYDVPDGFVWLGRGADLLGLPNAVVLMILIFLGSHFLMTRTKLGRAIYAVGGNPEAARLSGVRSQRVLCFCYAACGALAGLGGVVMASQLKSGAPTYGGMYELFVIAAVVVGGTSLSGGSGSIGGTLVGAFFIAVIQNGMNLTGVESYTQKVVLGLVILGAVLLDLRRKR